MVSAEVSASYLLYEISVRIPTEYTPQRSGSPDLFTDLLPLDLDDLSTLHVR
jgi:hypothetical protein